MTDDYGGMAGFDWKTARYEAAEKEAKSLRAQVAALQAEVAAERARADMHADLGRRTAAALGIEGDRSGMPETAVALQAEVSRLAELHGLYQDKAQRLQAEVDRMRERESAACHLAEVAMGDAARVAAERDALREALWLLVQAHDHGCGIADQIVNARAALERAR